MSKFKSVRSAFGYDVKVASDEAAVTIEGPSLTVQSMSEDADINVIVARFGITGKFPENPRVPVYADFSEVTDYRSALAAVDEAQRKFMEYPADVRAKFGNNPQNLLDFVSNPGNYELARQMGFLKPEVSSAGVNSVAGGAQGAPGAVPGGDQGAVGAGAPGVG